ncbi:MAG: glycosyltransferase [Shewanella sp.]|nr:glycosyltransferase [Shewanella sp.]
MVKAFKATAALGLSLRVLCVAKRSVVKTLLKQKPNTIMTIKPKIALIADLATAVGIAPDADLIHLTPHNWWLKINLFKPDFLLVESAWRGHNSRWQNQIVDGPSAALTQLVEYCKNKDIPAVFWNKEDPVHFHRFKQTALLFEYIMTTDSNAISDYWALDGNSFKAVDTLMFCAQPALQYPETNQAVQEDSLVFLGGFYGQELAQRSKQQLEILTALSDKQLQIYDRFWFEHKNNGSFPAPLKPFCHPAVDLETSFSLYRKYKIHLNFNTVQRSPSMLSRRVFELAASKAAILSSPSVAMTNIYGKHVLQITNATEACQALQAYQDDPVTRQLDASRIYEITLDAHTWRHRIQTIQQFINLR